MGTQHGTKKYIPPTAVQRPYAADGQTDQPVQQDRKWEVMMDEEEVFEIIRIAAWAMVAYGAVILIAGKITGVL